MLFYQFLISLVFLFLKPYFVIRFLINPSIWRWRLGLGKFPVAEKKSIWIHAASVGEINGITSVISTLIKSNPDCFLYLSTMTTTGLAVSQNYQTNIQIEFFHFSSRLIFRLL